MEILMLIVGIVTGVAGYKLCSMIRTGELNFAWYHYLIVLCLYAFALFGISFIGVSIEEFEPQAAGMATMLFGGILLVAGVLLYRFVFKSCIKTA